MKYGQFKSAWNAAFKNSGLSAPFGNTENLDLESMSRTFEVTLEPIGGFDEPPFTVMGRLSWSWRSLQTAWAATTEEDMLTELFGTREARLPLTMHPWLRVDITLSATLPYGQDILLPPASAWSKWSREVTTRLQSIEPIVPKETYRKGRDGFDVLAWSGEPKIDASCGSDGAIKLRGVQWTAWQSILLPRHFDDPDRDPDPHPHEQLVMMFQRVRASLQAWKQAIDHLA